MTDLRNAVRALRATPGFTMVALLVLTLGIGATTAIFSVVDAVVLRGLPFDEHDRLVAVGERGAFGAGSGRRTGRRDRDPQAHLELLQPQNYLDWIAQQQVFESMAADRRTAASTLRDARRRARRARGPARDGELLRCPAHPADDRPRLHGRERSRRPPSGGRAERRALAPPLRRRIPTIVGRTIPLDDGRVRGRRHHAGRR